MHFFRIPDFLHLMRTRAENGIVVIQGMLPDCHNGAGRPVEHIDILNIWPYIASFNMEVVDVRHSHDDHIGIHLHHQSNQAFFPDIIRLDARLLFGNSENLIIGIAGYVMDRQVGMCKQVIHYILEIFVKTTPFGVEHDMLIDNGEKTLIIGFFSFGIGIMFVPFLFRSEIF